MPQAIELEIISSTEAPVKVNVRQLYIPAYHGQAGVLENHKPYIAVLNPGELMYTDMVGKDHYLYIRDGFMEADKNKVSIISDAVEKGEDLDRGEIEAKLQELNENIKASTKLTADMTEEQMKKLPEDLAEAIATKSQYETRLEIVKKLEKKK